jgi:hypothetical protein
LGKAGLELLDYALAERRNDAAIELGKIVQSAAGSNKDPDLKKELLAAQAKVKKLNQQFAKVEQLRRAVETAPDDAGANLRYGKILCFERGEWSKGLPHLAKGSDSNLAKLAESELLTPEEPEEQVKLADAWWDLASESAGDDKLAFYARARDWYERALPTLEGLNKVKVTKRLAQVSKAQ